MPTNKLLNSSPTICTGRPTPLASLAIIILFFVFIVILYRNNQFKKQIGLRLEKRVKARSDELIKAIQDLEQSYADQETRITKMNSAILTCTIELETLCAETLQNQGLGKANAEYVEKMNLTVRSLKAYASKNMRSGENGM